MDKSASMRRDAYVVVADMCKHSRIKIFFEGGNYGTSDGALRAHRDAKPGKMNVRRIFFAGY